MSWRRSALLGGAASALAAAYAAYAWRRHLFARWLDIPPARYPVAVRRNLRVAAHDGVTLATDHYAPRHSGESLPTILIRTPYGKALSPSFPARRFAERGYHVVVQDVRGRFASDGEFEPFSNEAADGAATVAWLKKQPWFNGVLGAWGQSYLAYAQWALAQAAPEAVTAMFPSLPSARGPFSGRMDEAQLLELPLRWMVVLDALRYLPGGQGSFSPWLTAWRMSPGGQRRALATAFDHLPLTECDKLTIGREMPYFRQFMEGNVAPEWAQLDFAGNLGRLAMPIHLLGGWYDFMLGDMLSAFDELSAAGRQPYLTIGPWHHVHPEISQTMLREGLRWFDAHLKGEKVRLRQKPVRIFLMGAGQWRDFDSWPPPVQTTSLFLQANGRLATKRPPADAAPDSYLYDPYDPTPAVGGALFFHGAGRRDNRTLEARPDVLTFTTDVLQADVDVVGPVKAVLYVSSSGPYTDFFARLCDVHPNGLSMNVCDGIIRLYPEKAPTLDSGVMRVEISLLHTAHRFKQGHAIRLQLSSGAHPRFARNPGIAGVARSPADMVAVRQHVYHEEQYPSAVILPLL